MGAGCSINNQSSGEDGDNEEVSTSLGWSFFLHDAHSQCTMHSKQGGQTAIRVSGFRAATLLHAALELATYSSDTS